MLTRTHILTVGVASLALLGLTACSDATIPVANPDTTSQPDVVSSEAAVATTSKLIDAIEPDDDLVDLRGSKFDTIQVGSTLFAPPIAYLEGDVPTGVEPDLINAIGKKLDAEIVINNTAFPTLITGLQSGRYDLLMSGLSDTEARRELIDFVDYDSDDIAFYVQKGNPKKVTGDPLSLCGKTIAAIQGGSAAAWAQEFSDSECPSDKPATVTTLADFATALNNLQTGRADVTLTSKLIAPYTAATAYNGEAYDAVLPTEPISPTLAGIGVSKENSDLRDAVQKALQALIDDGTYGKILKAWALDQGAIENATINDGK